MPDGQFTEIKDNDNYETDPRGWEIIRDYIPKDKKIWCPFYCTGKQKTIFKELFDIDVIHEDEDFFENNKGDIVIDNPPFSKKREILTRLKELDKPFILIIPTCLLCLKWFQELFKGEIQMMIPTKRITFKHYKNPKDGYTPPFGSFYYCYKMNLPKDLIFI